MCERTIDLSNGSGFKSRYLDDVNGEFPRLDERFTGLDYRHGFYAGSFSQSGQLGFDSIVHQDLKLDKGGSLFCDSCHAGKTHVLPRHDEKAIDAFMTTEYEGKLSRTDGEDHSCITCHTDTMENAIFKDVWGIK